MLRDSFTILDQIDFKNCSKKKQKSKSETSLRTSRWWEFKMSNQKLPLEFWKTFMKNSSLMEWLSSKSLSCQFSSQETWDYTSIIRPTTTFTCRNKRRNTSIEWKSSIKTRTKLFFNSRETTCRLWWRRLITLTWRKLIWLRLMLYQLPCKWQEKLMLWKIRMLKWSMRKVLELWLRRELRLKHWLRQSKLKLTNCKTSKKPTTSLKLSDKMLRQDSRLLKKDAELSSLNQKLNLLCPKIWKACVAMKKKWSKLKF